MGSNDVARTCENNQEIKKVVRPQLDEWDLETIQQSIEIAMKSKSDSKVKHWKDG